MRRAMSHHNNLREHYGDERRALFLLGDGFEEIEAITPLDLLRRAGAEVDLLAVHPRDYDAGGDHEKARLVTGKNGLCVLTHRWLDDYGPPMTIMGYGGLLARYDALVLPGGPAVEHMRRNEIVVGLARDAHWCRSHFLCAICAAPLILKEAFALEGGVRHTAFPGCRDELPDALFDQAVVRDDLVITGRSAGAATEFGFAIIAALWDDARAAKVAAEIHAPPPVPLTA